jgi:predicted GH43/DUF377 family glycosyl hydrolase
MLSTLKKINSDIMQSKVNSIATPIVNPIVKPRLTNTLPVVTEKTSEEPPIFPNIIRSYPAFPRSLCDYSTLEYIDVKTLIDPEINLYYFNSAICKYKKQYRFFYRCSKNPKSVSDRIATCLLTTDLKVVPNTNKYIDVFSDWHESYKSGHMDKPREILYTYYGEDNKSYVTKSYVYKKNEHVEDPRVVQFNNSWFLTYTDGLAVGVAKLDLDTCEVIYSHFLKSPPKRFIPKTNDGREKNWIMCVDGDRLFALYSDTPRTFIEYDDTGTSLETIDVVSEGYNTTWPYGDIRGGCPPIEYDDETLIWFFHSLKRMNTTIGNDSGVYFIGAYLTTKSYPFQIVNIITHPVLMGVPSFVSETLYLQDNVVYPCGAITLDSQTFLISMGINDYRIAHLRVKKNMLIWKTKIYDTLEL